MTRFDFRFSVARRPGLAAGPCSLCASPATCSLRTSADGLTVYARACAAHKAEAHTRLSAVTPAEAAATVPPAQRDRRAQAAETAAARWESRAAALSRDSAALRGASSATYTLAAGAGLAAQRAAGLRAVAAALRA